MADNPAVVLVHGFWGNAGHWWKVIVELNKTRRWPLLRRVWVRL
jgi:pimeloyl-ACP methyl ester carboxylesterase